MIKSVEAWTLRLPLTRPVRFGSLTFKERDYCIVRLQDSSGLEGFGYALARGAPLAATVLALAPRVVGTDASASERTWLDLYHSSVTQGQRGAATRALSLVDIAIWDLRARAAGLPVHELLGGYRREVPASVGGGYYREARPPEEVRAELRGYADRGFRHLKVPAGGLAPREEEAWMRLVRETVGDDLEVAVDAHWTWRDTASACAVLERLEQFSLAWVEDPLPPEMHRAARELRQRVRMPLAIGDEQSGRWFYQDLATNGAADIWRVDVTTVGGFSEFRRVAALASTWGVPISTHVYPELHIHCAAAEAGVLGVEYVDPAAEIDLSHRFVSHPAVPAGGVLAAPTTPGLGFDLDWAMIDRLASEHVAHAA